MDASAIDLVTLFLAWYLVFVFSTTLHEAAHAWAALRLGDSTAYAGGQVSVNPVPHVIREPFGMVLVPLISFFLQGGAWMIGWASAPYDPRWAHTYPKRAGLMALAGPLANLALAVLAGIVIRLGVGAGIFSPPERITGLASLVGPGVGVGSEGLATILSVAFALNLVLFLFNLMPLPPLDGSSILQLFMSEDIARKYQILTSNPMWAIIGLLAAWRLFGEVFGPVFFFVLPFLYPSMS